MWSKFKEWKLPALWFAGIFALAGFTTTAFVWCDIFDDNWQYALFFFAISGGLLAVWGRLATHKQIKQSSKQIELSQQANRNDRFAKACEMLKEGGNIISVRGGLNILKDLREEAPETEYIRCTDILVDWIEYNENSRYAKWAFEIIFHPRSDAQEYIVEKSKLVSRLKTYPSFTHANLFNAELSKAQLFKANLLGVNLSGVNLSQANLSDANLYFAVLCEADLSNAYFASAKLSRADLSRANLSGTDLSSTDLSGADLVFADLFYADLSNANLSNANLKGVRLYKGYLPRANLSEVNLSWAELTLADMSEVKNLTVEQILSAKWYDYERVGEPPKLPKELLDDERVKEWLSESHGEKPKT